MVKRYKAYLVRIDQEVKMRTRLQDGEFKYCNTGIYDVKPGLRVYSTTNACSGKILVRLWKGYGQV